MAVHCAGCGTALADGAAFCASCGAPAGGPAAGAAAVAQVEYVQPRLRTAVPDFVRVQLHPGEQLLASYSASLFDHRRKGEFRHDKFLLTSERIIYFHTGLVHKGMGQMPYRGITGCSYSKGIRHGTVVVDAADAALTIGGVGNDDAAFAERVISALVAGRPLAAAP